MKKKKKTRKDLYTYGLNINFTNHWSTWSGRQIRKGSMWFIWCFQMGGISSECKKQERHGAHEGKFYCPSVQILISFTWYSTRCIFIRSPISTFMIEDGSSFFYFLLLCVSLSAMYIRNNSLHEYIKPSWARSNNLRCLLMINDPSRSKEKAATMLSYATQ